MVMCTLNQLRISCFQSKKSYKNSGTVHLVHSQTVKAYSFLDYIRGGTELACTISIDFTQSNGAPMDYRFGAGAGKRD